MQKTFAIVVLGLLCAGEAAVLAARPAVAAPVSKDDLAKDLAQARDQIAQQQKTIDEDTAAIALLQSMQADQQAKLDQAIRRGDEFDQSAIALQNQLELEQRVEAVRIRTVEQVSQAACRAQILHTEAEMKLLPPGAAGLAIKILEDALTQATAPQTAPAPEAGAPQ